MTRACTLTSPVSYSGRIERTKVQVQVPRSFAKWGYQYDERLKALVCQSEEILGGLAQSRWALSPDQHGIPPLHSSPHSAHVSTRGEYPCDSPTRGVLKLTPQASSTIPRYSEGSRPIYSTPRMAFSFVTIFTMPLIEETLPSTLW